MAKIEHDDRINTPMRKTRIESLYFDLCFFFLSCFATPMVFALQPMDKVKQVDVITNTTTGLFGFNREPPLTVEVRDVAINLRNEAMHAKPYKEDMFAKACMVLREVDNAYLSSETVHLSRTHLANNATDATSVETRRRAIALLGYLRNPEAIPILAERMHYDPAWTVRDLAAQRLGGLAGEAAIPELLRARVGYWKH
ncbi:MAG: HEAT repeat domain-containing protein [Candidatus Poribacteria bacterium]|nr:HEAT repeat domain-containing protein [Candidatus Poribacteria bacterium]MDE0502481.1 HEAT repeat domain-containing protein [Candidatus Poribacteria bacterium]